jgi:hypothetical protein
MKRVQLKPKLEEYETINTHKRNIQEYVMEIRWLKAQWLLYVPLTLALA